MNTEQRKKYLLIGLTAFGVVAASILLVFAIDRFDQIRRLFVRIGQILQPFTIGFVLAYLLLPVYNFLCHAFRDLIRRRRWSEKANRWLHIVTNALSVTLTMLTFFALLVGFGFLVLPEISQSILSIIVAAPETGRKIVAWAEKLLADNPEVERIVTDLLTRYMGNLSAWAESSLLPKVTELMNSLSSGILVTIMSTFTFLMDALIGIIAAIYMLLSKNIFAMQAKKLTYSILPVKTANVFLNNMRYVHKTFGGFISGKLLDSLIIGFICYFFMIIAGMPYPMLVAVIIGVTNVIPFFGPFIGAIPSALLILTVSPIQCLYFVIFVFALQQFDGNVLGPRILSGAVGIPSFWVMFSIIFCSGIFGFAGMIIGVPLFALLISLVSAFCRRSLEKKHLPVPSAEYHGLASIDPDSGELLYLPPRKRFWNNPDSGIRRLFRKLKKNK
ncbi:MAG: AI-2E family transporter [Ruminococcaceae bacterium]|nr:AI-2E family transporter [Oscillospiraceae bacterium]